MKAFWITIAHAALGGFASGFLAHVGGAHGLAVPLSAAGGSALTSVLSLFATPPTQVNSQQNTQQ